MAAMVIMTMLASSQTSGTTDYSLARVQRASGKLVFMRCEPVAEYDVVMEVDPMNWGSTTDTPEKIADFIVSACLRKAKGTKKKEPIDFDAVVIGSTSKDIAIKFKK